MSKAQAAWAVLTGLLIVAATILLTVPSAVSPRLYGSVCLVFGIAGWCALGWMIVSDLRAVKIPQD